MSDSRYDEKVKGCSEWRVGNVLLIDMWQRSEIILLANTYTRVSK